MDVGALKRRRVDTLVKDALSDEQRFVRGAMLASSLGALCWVCLIALL